MNNHDWETTDILICGCGPTGALLSTYLGQMRISNVVLEKEANITTDPRGIALDEDGIRILQGAGLYDSIYTEIGSCMGKFNFISGSGKILMKQPFVSMDYNTVSFSVSIIDLLGF
jgi:2-polyprenyl-6-methoxyphenol hydroxylase-like FAD-dependent oxidoreductase